MWLAMRMLFDQILAVNPAAAARGSKYVVRTGKTPVQTAPEARQVVGLRNRALIGLLVFTFARSGAALGMTLADESASAATLTTRCHVG
jgi:hypothetical protein